MKKLLLFFPLLLLSAFAFAQGFRVNKMTADIFLNAEGYFDVVENYELEFTQAKHGIFRNIVTEYEVANSEGKVEKRKLVIQNIDVVGHRFEVSSKLEQRLNKNIEIKIGDKNKLLTGLQHYEIKYRVYNAYLFDRDLVQFYWNIKPEGWHAIFRKIDLNIHTPEGAILSSENCFVYAGNAGSTSLAENFSYDYSHNIFSAKSPDFFYSAPGQSVTVLVKLPKDLIQETYITTPLWQEYGWVGIIACLLIIFWRVWWKYGKDEKVIATTSYYPPKGIDPAMAGYLINDRDDASDLIAFFPHWASQGFISITEIPKKGIFGKADMKLTKLKNLPLNVPEYESKLFYSLFNIWGNTVLMSSLTNTFYTVMNVLKRTLRQSAQTYYEARSNKVMKITIGVSIALGVILCPVFLLVFGVLAAVLVVVTCVFIAIMSFYLQKKNPKGDAVFSELKGFKQFIKMAEVNRIKTLIEQDPNYFEKTMSYALAFGLLDKWAEKFDALNIPPPNWYHSSSGQFLGMTAFSKSFSHSISTAQSSMVSTPSSSSSGSSSGGGSSGGGFGGGGGGSW